MSTKPLVFSLLDTPAVGGAETYLISNLTYLHQQGHPIILATNCPAIATLINQSIDAPMSFKIIGLPFKLDAIGNWKGLVKFFLTLPTAIRWLFQIKRQYLDKAPTVTCLLPGFSDRLVFSHWLKRWGYRLVWLEYGPLEPTFARNIGFPKLLYHLALHLPDKIITISEWTKASLIKTASIKPERISISYPGVKAINLDELRLLRQQGRAWLKEHGLSNHILITGLGRLASEKEFDILIEAFAQLVKDKRQVPVHLLLIGDGPEKDNLQRKIQQHRLDDRVTLTGFIDPQLKMCLLASSHLFVFPSAWPLEGFGMTTIEAMSAAVPVITTGYGPQAEIVQNTKTGVFFAPHDQNDLAVTLRKLIDNPEQRHRLGENARYYVQRHFSLQAMHQEISLAI